jgi:hypothetical protein
VSRQNQYQVGNLSLVCDGWIKILCLVWELCDLIRAQCGVVRMVYRSFSLVELVFVRVLAKTLWFKGLCMLCEHVCYPVPSVT